MKTENLFLLLVLVVFVSCSNRTQTTGKDKFQDNSFSCFDIGQVITRGDIYRITRPDTAVLNLYQGNGRFGCWYGPMDLHINPEKGTQRIRANPMYSYSSFCKNKVWS